MKKWYILSVLTLFFLSTVSGSFAASFTPDTGDVINVQVGHPFVVTLNRAVCYTNEITGYDRSVLNLIDMYSINPEYPPGWLWVGGMTTDVYTFNALKKGTTYITVTSGYGDRTNRTIHVNVS